ncbi:MAG: hypothetical protein IT470_00695, partial [Pseudomonadales bacterium]|nr:hypothetical protein [Pseudomonadales bacterium]
MSVQHKTFFPAYPLQDSYRLLRIYAWYRALLASVLWGLFVVGAAANVLGRAHSTLYGYTISVYTLLSLLVLGRTLLEQRSPSTWHVFTVCLVDIIFLSIIMYCSGGIATGLGSLIFITVAASSIFLQGQIATLLAALACIAILLESFVTGYLGPVDVNPLAVALLGLLLFVTSLLFQYLTRRILASQR